MGNEWTGIGVRAISGLGVGNEWTGVSEGVMILVCVYDVCMCAGNE